MANNSKKDGKPPKGDHENNNVNDNEDNVNDNTDVANIANPGISDNMGLSMVLYAAAKINLNDKWASIAAELGVNEEFAKQRMGKIQDKFLESLKGYVPPPINTQKRNRVEKNTSPSPQMTKRGANMLKDDTVLSDDGDNIPSVSTAGMTTPTPARPQRTVAKPAAHQPTKQRSSTNRAASQRESGIDDHGEDVPSATSLHEEQGRSTKRAKTQAKRDAEMDEDELYD
ncbi:hypothetical protein PG991_010819 [Apiospora marii]|uniref:Uncharacterized protein n=1 Tax=Apiospora marii TaxID=335849 RepID=A0ABR1RDG2_9PEZI